MTVKDRLIEFLRHKEISQSVFEKKCELSNGYVNNIRVSIGSNILQRIALKFPDLNTVWLLMGEGDMLKDGFNEKKPPENESLANYAEDEKIKNSDFDSKLTDLTVSEKNNTLLEKIINIIGESIAKKDQQIERQSDHIRQLSDHISQKDEHIGRLIALLEQNFNISNYKSA